MSSTGARLDAPRCACCGQPRRRLAELGATPDVFLCRRCALWAWRRAALSTGTSVAAEGPDPTAGADQVIVDRTAIHVELDRACTEFVGLIRAASAADLHRPSAGTRWTNQQLLFHLLFGYLVVLRLLPLVRLFGRLPDGFSRRFAALLNAATRPFHLVNYLGSAGGGTVLTPRQLEAWFRRVAAVLHRRLDAESDAALLRTMHFPVGWDPFFRDVMTLENVYHFGTQHFDYHRRQLTLGPAQG